MPRLVSATNPWLIACISKSDSACLSAAARGQKLTWQREEHKCMRCSVTGQLYSPTVAWALSGPHKQGLGSQTSYLQAHL